MRMGTGWIAGRRRALLAGAVAATLALAGCNLGARPVTVELKDPDNFGLPLTPTGMATGDVDGDGDIDVVGVGARGLAVLTNDGAGTLSIDFPAAYHPEADSPSLVDLDGDADLDLLSTVRGLSDPNSYVPAVRRNDGAGTFGPAEALPPDPPPGELSSVVPSDVDGDGDADVLAAFRQGDGRSLGTYLNDGTGTFGSLTTVPLAPVASDMWTPLWLVAGDIDGDGDDDAVATDVADVTTPGGDAVERTVALVALNDGSGAFAAAPSAIDVGVTADYSRALTPVLADFDEDGNLDLAVGGSGSMTTLRADGQGGFEAPQDSMLVINTIDFVVPADIDGDGHLDLVGLHNIIDPRFGIVAYGDGAGGFDDHHQVVTGTALGSDGVAGTQVGVADLDGDGDSDILFLGGSLGIVENAVEGRPVH